MSPVGIQRLVAVGLLLIAAACSNHDAAPAQSAASASAAQADSSSTKQKAACDLVTASDVSAIVGASLVTDRQNGGDSNTCRFTSPTGTLPSVEVQIDWGGGAAAMTATGLLPRHEPGIADPLAGIGDQATAIGPAVWVRVGEDLLNFTLLGVDDGPAVARRIVGLMRPRMGPSAQTKDSEAGMADAEKAGELVSGLLDGLTAANARSSESAAGTDRSSSAGGAPIADEPLRPATGAPVRIPLVAGLTLVGAKYEPGRGDYEPIVTVTGVTADLVTTAFSSNLPEGTRLAVKRDVRREDLRTGRSYLSWYHAGDPRVFEGSTSFSLSSAVYAELSGTGVTRIDRLASETNPLAAIARLASGSSAPAPAKHRGVLQRVEPHALAFPVLLNDVPSEVPVIHARGQFDDATADYYVLDDPANPLLLRIAGQSVGRIVRISYPVDSPSLVDDDLAKDGRVEIHGIFFDFGKATIRPESETSLRDIASALTRHPTWAVTIEGHTDNIGGDADNVDLSRRRADAVKQALVDRYRVDARTLSTAGRGASQPAASNATLSGRARNRRVELIRQ